LKERISRLKGWEINLSKQLISSVFASTVDFVGGKQLSLSKTMDAKLTR